MNQISNRDMSTESLKRDYRWGNVFLRCFMGKAAFKMGFEKFVPGQFGKKNIMVG